MECLEPEKQYARGVMFPSTSTLNFTSEEEARSSYGTLHSDHQAQRPNPIKHLILDCSGVSYVDLAGSETLIAINIELETQGTILIFASCSDYLTSQLDHCEFFLSFPKCRLYPTILDTISSLRGEESNGSRGD